MVWEGLLKILIFSKNFFKRPHILSNSNFAHLVPIFSGTVEKTATQSTKWDSIVRDVQVDTKTRGKLLGIPEDHEQHQIVSVDFEIDSIEVDSDEGRRNTGRSAVSLCYRF